MNLGPRMHYRFNNNVIYFLVFFFCTRIEPDFDVQRFFKVIFQLDWADLV